MPASPDTAAALRAATIEAAEAVMPYVGRGNKNAADEAAVLAIRNTLNNSPNFYGIVQIGEGEKDDAPMLFTGEKLGTPGAKPPVDIAVDPLERTSLVAVRKRDPDDIHGGAYSVIVAGPNGSLMPWNGKPYMNKLAVGEEAADLITGDIISVLGEPRDTFIQIAKALHKRCEQLVVAILDRPRNKPYIDAALALGCQLRLLTGGDLEQGILTSYGEAPPVDVLIGIGGAPEAVLQAGAHRALGRGAMQAYPYSSDGSTPKEPLGMDDLVGTGPITFAATGIIDGEFLRGGGRNADGLWLPGGETIVLQRQP